MICDECGGQEARFDVSMVVNGEVTVRHLCPDCMQKMNKNLLSGNIRSLLSSIFTAISGTEQAEKPQPDIVCPRCGTTFARFTATGRLGCPGCYEAFGEHLEPMLSRIHGHAQHAGRQPLVTPEAQKLRDRQEDLTRRMQQAVQDEDFETAARLRDELHALPKGGDEA